MRKDMDLEVLLTKMLNSIHFSFLGNGQTPEIKILPHDKFTFHKQVLRFITKITIYLIYLLRVNNLEPLPGSSTDGDANCADVNNDCERLYYYSWRDKNETPLSRGQALFFSQAKHEKLDEIESAVASHAFNTTQNTFHNMSRVISNGKLNVNAVNIIQISIFYFPVNLGVCDSGCILVCVFATLSKKLDQDGIYEELMVDVGGEAPVPIQSITSLFVSPKCSKWIGKPKLFFFLDPSQQFDAGNANPHVCIFN
jgi:hypothetical protein